MEEAVCPSASIRAEVILGVKLLPLVSRSDGNFGCGFGSWIWILLILFYAGQGGNAGYGGNSGCCCNTKSNCCCGNTGNYGNSGLFGGLGNCGGGYLFLLVILFLCNGNFGCGNNVASCGNLI